jgi:HSP20 family protein
MLTRWNHNGLDWTLFDDFQRRMDRLLADSSGPAPATWPRVDVFDAGTSFVVQADVPGLKNEDVNVTIDDGTLSIKGKRTLTAPDGGKAQRRERRSFEFSRSFTLPTKIDPEKSAAEVKDGVLTVTLVKAPDAQPRRIGVKAS